VNVEIVLFIDILQVFMLILRHIEMKLNTNQPRWVIGLFTGHYHVIGHLFKLGITNDPTCVWCLEEVETSSHISL
jgi:hypothetical protein